MSALVVGTRGSELALCQTRQVVDSLKHLCPGLEVNVRVIKTTGDKILDTPLAKIGDKGLFVKEIEQALISGEIDFAVHSAKDLPSEMDDRLFVAAYPEREDPSDVLVSKNGILAELPPGSVIGTSSVRRRCQIAHFKPDLKFLDLRGNLDTRLRKMCSADYDAIVLAHAGLKRLNLQQGITETLSHNVCLPAAGQGALAIQCRTGDDAAQTICLLDHATTRACVQAERSLLAVLNAGCQTPVAALAIEESHSSIQLTALVTSIDGSKVIRKVRSGGIENPDELGRLVAEALLDSGAAELLETARGGVASDMGAAG